MELQHLDNVTLIIEILRKHGEDLGPFLPWHKSKDPYYWCVAELLLRLTTRKVVGEVFNNFISIYPDWQKLNDADENDVSFVIKQTGFQVQKAKRLKKFAEIIVNNYHGCLPVERKELIDLPGIGNYGSDALLLHVFDEKRLPLDSNAQRIFRRLYDFTEINNTRRNNPYNDQQIIGLVDYIVKVSTVQSLKNIHLGLLSVAWNNCRFFPSHKSCPLLSVCRAGLKSV